MFVYDSVLCVIIKGAPPQTVGAGERTTRARLTRDASLVAEVIGRLLTSQPGRTCIQGVYRREHMFLFCGDGRTTPSKRSEMLLLFFVLKTFGGGRSAVRTFCVDPHLYAYCTVV